MKVDENINQCTGCSACYSICPVHAITMKDNEEGFLYPIINKEQCTGCGICHTVCSKTDSRITTNNECYAAYSVDENTLMSSSSGGMFSLFANHVLEYSGFVSGAIFDENFDVKHIISKNNIKAMRGSKYVQSSIGDVYIEIQRKLRENKLILFSGTPCQVNGLKAFLNKNYNNLYCIDFICHGVPSPKSWKSYLTGISHGKQPQTINFRSKKTLWENYSLNIKFKDGSEFNETIKKNIYLHSFDIQLRMSCYECPVKVKSLSDITIGDFWGINNLFPDFYNEKGVSTVIIHTERGKDLFENVKDNICYKKVDFSDIAKYNTSVYNSSLKPKYRDSFFTELQMYGYNKAVKKNKNMFKSLYYYINNIFEKRSIL